ncbi:DoxX-like family protein [uncultured Maribacter sp.]|uniref:DoxX-like family protein n=1 Tax=uncultured Maribacter sp. TaxID=431308 RepID=UPI00262E147C|nr:DoxX-like family protein [uncultured Maribacter sp.]
MISKIITYIIALVWLVNGLYCKVLNQVPRHQEIVSHILGESYGPLFTILIGVSEVAMCIWVISRIQRRINAIVQMGIIAIMNIMEFFIVPDLLLWGKYNSIFAFLFIMLIYINEFHLRKGKNQA